jgi:hypothetical protein
MISKDDTTQQRQAVEQTQAMILLQEMKQQEIALQQQADNALAQLTATQGAIQVLEALLQRSHEQSTEGESNGNK